MKNFNNIEELENLLGKSLTSHKVSAPDVWTSVANTTGVSTSLVSKTISYFSSISNVLKVALFAGGIIAATAILFNENTKAAKQTNDPIQVVDNEDLISNAEEELVETANEVDKPNFIENQKEVEQFRPNKEDGTEVDNAPVDLETKNESPENDAPDKEKDQEQKKDESVKQVLLLPSKKAICIGEKVSIANNINANGSWYINNELKEQDQNQIVLNFNEEGVYKVSFKSENRQETSTLIRVEKLNAEIVVSEPKLGSYIFTLNKTNLIANWYLDGELLAINAYSLKHEIEKVGKHHITAIPVNHKCAAELNEEIEVKATGSVEFYNVFSPNGDGKNDTYLVNIKGYDNFSISIYNNLNSKVFNSQNPSIGWNGTEFNTGVECAAGEYIARISYKLRGEEPKTKNLKLTLIRD